jgi:hypothetical protein
MTLFHKVSQSDKQNGETPAGSPKHRCEENTKIDLKETE